MENGQDGGIVPGVQVRRHCDPDKSVQRRGWAVERVRIVFGRICVEIACGKTEGISKAFEISNWWETVKWGIPGQEQVWDKDGGRGFHSSHPTDAQMETPRVKLALTLELIAEMVMKPGSGSDPEGRNLAQ